MGPVFRTHRPEIVIDDETWAALDANAQTRGETTEDVIVYAIEKFLEQQGFAPAWALSPTRIVVKGADTHEQTPRPRRARGLRRPKTSVAEDVS